MSDTPAKPRGGLADLFVSRPIFGIVINLLILIAGLAALVAVDVREMPDVDQPVLSVRTTYEGAVPATVDREVTQVLEDALSALEGLSYMESTSTTGSSRITIDLSEGTDVDVAANEAREIVSSTLRDLPDDIEDDPTVTKSDSNADAIIRLALMGDASLDALTELAEGVVYDRLSTIDGIAEVTLRGEQPNEFRVTLDMPALLSRGMSLTRWQRCAMTRRWVRWIQMRKPWRCGSATRMSPLIPWARSRLMRIRAFLTWRSCGCCRKRTPC
jgi:HAE1 family hydrophobic/amphiphilic exporter-1